MRTLFSEVFTRLAALAALPLACQLAGTGQVQVFLEAEDTIPEGLAAGAGEDQVVDGWTVDYDAFLVVVGNFRAARSSDPAALLEDPRLLIVDMLALPAGGLVLAEFDDVAAERWDRVGYDLANASAAVEPAPGLDAADAATMIDNGWSLYVAGTLSKADGQSCVRGDPAACAPAPTIRFAWGLAAGTSFDECAPPSGDAGFAVPSGGTVQVKPTIHGDHWFFTNLTQGAEITERRAQWIADCDLDQDGEVTIDELHQVKAAEVFPIDVYNLAGASIPIDTAYDYLEAQARTLGDYQGEGECPTRGRL